jgi:hypothetical protein
MKYGKSLNELAEELTRQANVRTDLIVPTEQMHMNDEAKIFIPTQGDMTLTPHAHSQVAARLGIPSRYYEKMKTEAPHLLAENANHWFQTQQENRTIRMLDGNVRAVLSDRYHRIDNDQIAASAFEAFSEYGQDIEIASTEVTDNRLFINAVFPKIEGAVAVGDPVRMGLTISNSEIGGGALDIKPMIYRLICTNGMVTSGLMDNGRFRRTHLGGRVQAGDDFTIYQNDTIEADDKALMLKIRDTIKQLSDPEGFARLVEEMRRANETDVVQHPVRAVELLTQRTNLTQGEGESVLENLLRGDSGLGVNLTQWGMANAVTRLANNIESYDRSQELMELGGKVVSMAAKDWKDLVLAA